MNKLTTFIASVTLLATASIANAATIVGQIKLSPSDTGNSATVTHDGTTASFIDFADNSANGIQMTEGTGDFAGIVGNGSIADIDLDPFTAINPLWSIGGFSFSLETITYNSVIEVPNTTLTFVTLAGAGTISGNGFDKTVGAWTMSLDSTGGTFNWSSTVPEPASLALLGLGLLGLGAAARRRS